MYSHLASPRETRATFERFGLVTRHRLGQNFLVNDDVVGRILALSELDAGDVVYEVGPGIGTLTCALLEHAGAVVAVEADRRLPAVLVETCARDKDRLAIVQGDALRVEPEELRDAVRGLGLSGLGTEPVKLVSNLPYQVAATVLLRSFERMPAVRRAVVMVQAEVADRICAVPGTKAYGAYTAKLALWTRVTGRFGVGPHNFVPAPHVDSAVVRLDRIAEPDDVGALASAPSPRRTATVIDAAFAQRRKTIRNSMVSSGIDRVALDAAFEIAGIDPGARAETLAPAAFVALAAALLDHG